MKVSFLVVPETGFRRKQLYSNLQLNMIEQYVTFEL